MINGPAVRAAPVRASAARANLRACCTRSSSRHHLVTLSALIMPTPGDDSARERPQCRSSAAEIGRLVPRRRRSCARGTPAGSRSPRTTREHFEPSARCAEGGAPHPRSAARSTFYNARCLLTLGVDHVVARGIPVPCAGHHADPVGERPRRVSSDACGDPDPAWIAAGSRASATTAASVRAFGLDGRPRALRAQGAPGLHFIR